MKELPRGLQKLLDSGFPVSYAKFIESVDNMDGTPEYFFSEESHQKSRNVEMTWTIAGLICKHRDVYFPVPLSNVKFARFKY